jgi:gliding motility-associated-like protein
VQDINGCLSAVNSVTVEEPTPLILDITGVSESCAGACDGSISWSGLGGTPTYQITMNGLAQGASPIVNLCAGNYSFVMTDSRGCSVDTVLILNPALPVEISSVSSTDDGCSDACDGTITVSSPTAVNYVLSNGSTSTTGNFTNLCSGSYVVQAIDGNGCTTSVDVIIGTAIPAEADFAITPGQVSELNAYTQILNFSSNADSYVWTVEGPDGFIDVVNGDINSYDFPAVAGGYTVCLTAISESGCQDTLCAPILVTEEFTIFVPNTFTPDGDEFNQHLEIFVNGIDDFGFSMLIFNRWGEVIWESNDPSVGWDGTYNGSLVQDGTYVWKIVVKDPNNDDRKEFIGHINVLK